MSLSENRCSPGSEHFLECLLPIPHRLAIHFYNDMPDNRRSDPFVGEDEVNGRIAAVEFEDGPHRGADLLALHVGGISGNTQSTESDKGRDDCVISAGATRLRLFRHGADLIGGWVYVNYPGASARPCSSRRRFAHNRRERSKPKSKLTFDLFVSFCSNSKLPSSIFDQLLAPS